MSTNGIGEVGIRSEASSFGRTVQEVRESPGTAIVRGARKVWYFLLAGIFFVIGVLGVFLPGLPATPFLLLTSYYLVRTSPRLNERMLRSRLLGPILTDWQVHGGIRRHVRYKAVLSVAIAVLLTIWLSSYSLWPSVAVVSLALVGVVVILRLPEAR